MTETLTFVDTHAHLNDDQFAVDAGEVVQRAAQLGVTRIVNVAFTERLWEAAIGLAASYPGVFHTLGIHPNSAGEWSPRTRDDLIEQAMRSRPVAIGETGLDYYWDRTARAAQMVAFAEQLDIAKELRLPVIIHMRGDVEADIRSTLETRGDVMCVFHSFDGSSELCHWILDRGWMIGAGGLMSRRSAKTLRSSLAVVPMGQLLLETDSPYLAPTGWSEKRNTPESIPIIAAHVARLLDQPIDEVASKTSENAQRVFSFERQITLDSTPLMGTER